MLGQYADFVTVASGLGTLVMGGIGWMLHSRDEIQQLKMDSNDERVSKLDAKLNAAFLQIDKMKEDRMSYMTREDHEKFRIENKADFAALRLEIKNDIEQMGKRIVEQMKGRS